MGKPRLPWKRGPVAWRIVGREVQIKEQLRSERGNFLSLRGVAKCFGVSTQPFRDWTRLGYLHSDGPRGQFSKCELHRFLDWLAGRAEPFSTDNYTMRLRGKSDKPRYPFQKLSEASFEWPVGQKALTPKELAELIGCHPSLIRKATNSLVGKLAARRTARKASRKYTSASRERREVTRHAWQRRFPGTIVAKARLPSIPSQPQSFKTNQTAALLHSWGMIEAKPYHVRRLIKLGKLEAARLTVAGRLLFVTRRSLKKLRTALLTSPEPVHFLRDAARVLQTGCNAIAGECRKSHWKPKLFKDRKFCK